jgi:molybdopterin-guanine dinucleotide biosynthesis protein B
MRGGLYVGKMKVLSVVGISKSGKTTTIENIIRELTRRGRSVGTIKEIHFHEFKMDMDGTNTDRHKQAGATLVTARGDKETDILFQEKLPVNEILRFYNQDYVIMEGVRDGSTAKIVTAHDIEGIESRLDGTVIAISGRIASKIREYKGVPVINSMTDIEALVDLIEKRSFRPLPDVSDECCRACGFTCCELGARIAQGLSHRGDCVLDRQEVVLRIDGTEIPMVPFVQRIIKNTIIGISSELNGYSDNGDIEICVRR